jgi:mannose-1-phosphate guanylyltransferase/phosphomannomutase
MRPLTETIPKPLLPFMNRPFLDQVLDHLGRHGVEEAICSSPYLESVFRGFLDARGDAIPRVRWITEQEPLGTAGAIAGAREHLGDTFFALNGDVLTDLDLTGLVTFHRERGAHATIALTPVEDARAFGLVETDDEQRVLAFREKPADLIPGTINAGTYVLEPSVLDGIPTATMVSIERETFPALIERGAPVFGFVAGGYWRDLGTPEAYLEGHMDALDGRIEGFRDLTGPIVGAAAAVDPEAFLGRQVIVGPSAVVAARARVERSILHERARVHTEARVEGSILGPGSVVEHGAELRGGVLAEGASIAPGTRAEGVRVGPGARFEASP